MRSINSYVQELVALTSFGSDMAPLTSEELLERSAKARGVISAFEKSFFWRVVAWVAVTIGVFVASCFAPSSGWLILSLIIGFNLFSLGVILLVKAPKGYHLSGCVDNALRRLTVSEAQKLSSLAVSAPESRGVAYIRNILEVRSLADVVYGEFEIAQALHADYLRRKNVTDAGSAFSVLPAPLLK